MKKRIIIGILLVAILAGSIFFLWPRSFADVPQEVRSVVVTFIENTLEHEMVSFEFNAQDPEFAAIMETLDQYSYHMSLGTVSAFLENRISIKDNNAGYWLHIDMYTEPGRCGDHYGIRSGGTGEVIAGDGVYRVGYWGNGKALEMMDAFYQMFMEE